jgi:hypothetical protein
MKNDNYFLLFQGCLELLLDRKPPLSKKEWRIVMEQIHRIGKRGISFRTLSYFSRKLYEENIL